MTAKYGADGQVCEMVLEARHYQTPEKVDLRSVIPGKLEDSLIDELVPIPERGEPIHRWSKKEPKDGWLDTDSYMAGGVSYLKRSYENVSIEQHGYYNCHENPHSADRKGSANGLDCSDGGDEVVVIRWTKRACGTGKASELERAVPIVPFVPVSSSTAGVVPDEGTAVKVAEAIFLPIFGEEEVTKFLPYHAQLKDGIWTVYGTLKPNSRGGTPQLRIQKKDGKVLEVWHSQ